VISIRRFAPVAPLRATVTTAVAGLLVTVVLAVAFGAMPYQAGIVIETLFWMAAASGWNILGGFNGLSSLGHALFVGVSGYLVAFAVTHDISWWLATPVTVGVVTVAGTALLYPGFRLKGPFFSLATFVLPLIATTLAIYLVDFTGGPQGRSWPFTPSVSQFVFVERAPYILTIGAIATLAVTCSVMIFRSSLGREMRAVADDDIAAAAAGVPVTRTRLIAAAVSIAICSLAGCFYVTYIAFIDPDSAFGLDVSLKIVLVTILGGMARPLGPVLGAAILIPIDSVLAGNFSGGVHTLLYGVLLVGLVMFLPRGVLGGVMAFVKRGVEPKAVVGGSAGS
jgi:branched-chain amino acid transport system permease protein